MRIEVTQSDIEKGKRSDCERCPLALAISRALGRPVAVTYASVAEPGKAGGRNPICWLPVVAGYFASGFDSGGNVFPFAFDLDL